MLSTLNFLLCFSTNLNVSLAICMLFCFLEGLWDDLKLERLFIKTNDLVQRKDMMVFSTSKFCPIFPGAGAPISHGAWRLGQMLRASVKPLWRNLSDQFWDMFFGGWEGYGIQIVFGRIFLFLQIFVVEIENYFLFQKKSIGGPVLQISFMTSINSRHHWQHEYLYSDLICPRFWVRFFIKIIDFRNHPLQNLTEFRHCTAAKKFQSIRIFIHKT